jgi:glycosyltransferase involved in cell wall biosynthesis
MRIAIITDAWTPQVNGVVTTLVNVTSELAQLGHELLIVSPELATRKLGLPRCNELELAFAPRGKVARMLDGFAPEAIHIATEGPIGIIGRRYCITRGLVFNTAYHTRFPEYIRARWHVPMVFSYKYLRWFHCRSVRVLVATPSVMREMERRGFRNMALWQRGVDTQLFHPRQEAPPGVSRLPRPLMLYVGRVAVEKNLEAYLRLDVPGTKLVVGHGPDVVRLQARYSQARFLGRICGEELARYYSASDVFVFPSLTDTFGLVLLEAMACGTPVASYPAPGPVDVITPGVTGAMDRDLKRAVESALKLDRGRCAALAQKMTWRLCAEEFLMYLSPVGTGRTVRPHRRRRFTLRRVA